MDYEGFLASKLGLAGDHGFAPIELPAFLKPFQQSLLDWSIRRGRSEIMADCGLGKTPMQLVWADNVIRQTNKPVLILTPLGVTGQTLREAGKFGFDAEISRDGKFRKRIVIANYEKLHLFKPADFGGVSCDEASILKNFKGATKAEVTEFMRTIAYRLLCTATPAPNDYIELGTSAEALGEMGYQDMLTRFFRLDKGEYKVRAWARQMKYRMRPHGERDFWRWVCSWARAVRKPSDLGFEDDGYVLPGLVTREHVIAAKRKRDGWLLDLPARGLPEQQEERRRTIPERCEKVAELVKHNQPAIAWCHLNPEGDLLEKLIPDSVQVSGSDPDEFKEEAFLAFAEGRVRVMITKPTIGGFGLNWQHCAHQTFFPSHSFEQWYQCLHRSLRFGQTRVVEVDEVASEGEAGIVENRRKKIVASDAMFDKLIGHMNDALGIRRINQFTKRQELPSWLALTS